MGIYEIDVLLYGILISDKTYQEIKLEYKPSYSFDTQYHGLVHLFGYINEQPDKPMQLINDVLDILQKNGKNPRNVQPHFYKLKGYMDTYGSIGNPFQTNITHIEDFDPNEKNYSYINL